MTQICLLNISVALFTFRLHFFHIYTVHTFMLRFLKIHFIKYRNWKTFFFTCISCFFFYLTMVINMTDCMGIFVDG